MRSLIIGCLITVVFGCTSKEEAPATPEPPAAAEVPAPPPTPAPTVAAFDAQQTFNTICATCHGTKGLGDGPAGQALNPRPASFSDPEFWKTRDRAHVINVIKNGGASVGKSPLMVPYGSQFSDEQIGQLADIVMTFKPSK